jgi:hypothetical protein
MIKKILIGLFILIGGLAIVLIIPERRNQLKTKNFTVRYSAQLEPSGIKALADALQGSYARIGAQLKTSPAENIEVNIYGKRWRYVQATKNWGASGSIDGIARLHFVTQAWSEPDNRKVAIHEFAHTVVLKLLIAREPEPLPESFDQKFATFPLWLWEAVSVYEAGQFVDPNTLDYFRDGQYPKLGELSNRMQGGKIYTCGYTVTEYILATYGEDGLIRLIANYGDVKATFHVTEDQFSQEWYAFVSKKYLPPL